MANFLYYKYRFEQTVERSLFSEDGKEVSDSYLNERFAEDFENKYKTVPELNLYDVKENKQKEEAPEIYVNKIKRYESGIVLLEVRNNKHKKVMPIDKTEAVEIDHYPFCWVIVDCRPESRAILVQQKNDAFKNTDTVVGLIVDYCSRELGLVNLNYQMIIDKRMCLGSIWDIVKIRTANGQDRVKSLSIKIDGKKPNDKNEVDTALQMILEKLAAPEGELKLTSDDNARKILDETKEDVRNTVDMLIENKYRMRIGFDKSGTVEYGKEAEAVYGIADSVCQNFDTGQLEMMDDGKEGYAIEVWLNTLVPEDDAHTYIKAERGKRNGRGKKK